MNTATKIQPGSKTDKLIKLFLLKEALLDIAGAGGLEADPKLKACHDEIAERWSDLASECDMSDEKAHELCTHIVHGE